MTRSYRNNTVDPHLHALLRNVDERRCAQVRYRLRLTVSEVDELNLDLVRVLVQYFDAVELVVVGGETHAEFAVERSWCDWFRVAVSQLQEAHHLTKNRKF